MYCTLEMCTDMGLLVHRLTEIESFPQATEQHHWQKSVNCERGWCKTCEYADGLITVKLVSPSLGTVDRWDMEGVCMCVWVCVCASEKGGTHSYIMQISSHILIRAAEQVPILWINLLIVSSGNQILMDRNIWWEWFRLRAGTQVMESVCTSAILAPQSQGRGDFELCTHTRTAQCS